MPQPIIQDSRFKGKDVKGERALRAQRALCRILFNSYDWSYSVIREKTGIPREIVSRALKNVKLKTRVEGGRTMSYYVDGTDVVTTDKQFVNKDLLRDLLNKESPPERVQSESVGSDLDSDSDPRPTGTKQRAAKTQSPRFPKLTHSDRALCRILYHEQKWKYDLVAEALGRSRPGGNSPICRAVKNIPNAKGSDLDDPSRDHEFVDKARLAELIRTHSPSPHPGRRSTSRAKTPRFNPYERSPGKQGKTTSMHASGQNAADWDSLSEPDLSDCPPRSHHVPARDADSDRLSPSNSSNSSRTCRISSRRAASPKKYPTTSNQMPSLFEFLANIRPEIDLSDRQGLFIHRGIDTIAKLRAMKSWGKEDLSEALSDWFQVTVKSEKYAPLNDYELVALRQAIQKL